MIFRGVFNTYAVELSMQSVHFISTYVLERVNVV